jgi:hypothetical protein
LDDAVHGSSPFRISASIHKGTSVQVVKVMRYKPGASNRYQGSTYMA